MQIQTLIKSCKRIKMQIILAGRLHNLARHQPLIRLRRFDIIRLIYVQLALIKWAAIVVAKLT
jgi:hypothetical protein